MGLNYHFVIKPMGLISSKYVIPIEREKKITLIGEKIMLNGLMVKKLCQKKRRNFCITFFYQIFGFFFVFPDSYRNNQNT
jgi:hypothetical protein